MKDLAAELKLNWDKGLTAGESMAGGNTTSTDDANYAMKGPGSKSVYAQPETTDTPDLDIPSGSPSGPAHLVAGGKKTEGSWTTSPMQTGFTKAGE